jgi:hypothetical protein
MTSKDFDKARFLAGLAYFSGSRLGIAIRSIGTSPLRTARNTSRTSAALVGVTNQIMPGVRLEEFQHWTLTLKGNKGRLSCDDGNGKIVFTKRIKGDALYLAGNVIMLPREY